MENNQTDLVTGKKTKKKKVHGLTLASGIFTVLFAIILVGLTVLVGFSFVQILNSGSNPSDAAAIFFVGWLLYVVFIMVALFLLVVAIMYLVLGIFLINSSVKDDKVFKERRGFIITTIVFDFIMIIMFLILAFSSEELTSIVCFGIASGLSLFSGILKIVDLKLFKKRQQATQSTEKVVASPNNVNFEALKQGSSSKLENELKKLTELKASGMITDDEFETMRKRVLDEYTKK